jgi:adenylate cyclase
MWVPSAADLREALRRTGLPGWASRLAQAGIVTADPEVRRRQAVTNIAAYVAAVGGGLFHLVSHALYDFWGLMPIHGYNLSVAALALVVPRLHRFGEHAGAIVFVTVVIVGHAFVVLALGRDSDLQFYYVFAGAMLFLFGAQNWRLFLGFFAFAFAVALLAFSLATPEGFLLPDDHAFRESVALQALANGILINAVLIGYALRALWRAERQLAREYERSEQLLLSPCRCGRRCALAAALQPRRDRCRQRIVAEEPPLAGDPLGFASGFIVVPPSPASSAARACPTTSGATR